MDLFRGPHKILPSQTDCSFVFDAAGETVTVVGDADPALMKYFDCTRTSIRSPFDDDVVFQFEYMEYVRHSCELTFLNFYCLQDLQMFYYAFLGFKY
jgi:hypothetical protein